eukprot:COSAG05_NODE_23929_length_255_cov_0.301282_1_plen_64_part_01
MCCAPAAAAALALDSVFESYDAQRDLIRRGHAFHNLGKGDTVDVIAKFSKSLESALMLGHEGLW